VSGRLEHMSDNTDLLFRVVINGNILLDFSTGGQFKTILNLQFSMLCRKETSKGLVLDILCFTIGML